MTATVTADLIEVNIALLNEKSVLISPLETYAAHTSCATACITSNAGGAHSLREINRMEQRHAQRALRAPNAFGLGVGASR